MWTKWVEAGLCCVQRGWDVVPGQQAALSTCQSG